MDLTSSPALPAKFEEQPQNVPTIADLLKANSNSDKNQLISAEKILLETLEWNAHSATHLHFAQCYISKGILFPKDTIDGQPVAPKDKKVIIRCIELIAKISLDGRLSLHVHISIPCAVHVIWSLIVSSVQNIRC